MEIIKIAEDIKKSEDAGSYLYQLIEETRKDERNKVQDRFFDVSIDMLCIADMKGYFTKVSKSFTLTLGYSEEELLTRPFKDFVVEDDKGGTDDAYDDLLEGKAIYDFENRYRCKDGSIKWLAWHSVSVPEEELIYGIARDVTDQKNNQSKQKNYTVQLEALIKEKNDSLNYARTLQDAIIPSRNNLGKVFPDSFVFHAPKEIVSGDFCWHEQVGDTIIIAAADCTGHGVPGAMMTMVCASLLTRTVKEFCITEPGKILDKVRELLVHSFKGSEVEMKDGMDISLCAINTKTLKVEWSGANNPLVYFHDKVLHELDGDKQPIGRFESYNPFTTHTIQLNKGDMLYMFSDGLADQFGGEKGKKLMYRQVKDKFTKLVLLSMRGQKERLHKMFHDWKGNLEQIDDVLVIGIRL
jgi:PAS domain S-box-containing protein